MSGKPARFKGEVLSNGKTATGILVPDAIVDALAGGRRPPVRATLNGYTYRTSVSPMGGRFMLPVSGDVRDKAGVAAGDLLEVTLVLDTEPRRVEVPPDLAAALSKKRAARAAFDALSYSKQQRLVLPIEAAKTPETRARRVAKALELLRDGAVLSPTCKE